MTMKQAFFLLTLLLLALATTAAQLDHDEATQAGARKRRWTRAGVHGVGDAHHLALEMALKQQCCDQLEQVPPTCRCKAVRSTVVQELELQQQQGEGGGGGHQQMLMMAKNLPSTCNMYMYPSYYNTPITDDACYC